MNRKLLTLLIISLLIGSCNKDDTQPMVAIATESPSPIDGGGLTLIGTIGYISATDHGFIIYRAEDESSYAIRRISLGSPESRGSFSAQLTSGLDEGETYLYRAYMIRNGEQTEGHQQSFIWTGDRLPEISDFFPKNGHIGDTMTIEGRYFGDHQYIVFGGSKTESAISSTDSYIKVVVPELESVETSIHIWKNIPQNAKVVGSFRLEAPEITSFEPNQVDFREIITINGDHFDNDLRRNEVRIDGKVANVIASSRNSLSVVLPDDIETSYPKITVRAQLQDVESIGTLEINGPEIDLSPTTGNSRDEITITGSNFHPVYYQNKVFIGDAEAEVQYASTRTKLVVEVPEGPYPNKVNNISVSVLDKTAMSDSEFEIQDTWRVVSNDIPISYYGHPGTFVLGSKAYLICNSNDYTDSNIYNWEYNPETNEWAKHALPFSMNYSGDAIGNGQNGFVYTGEANDNFWMFDQSTMQWQQMADFIGPQRGGATTFSLNGKIYLGLGGSKLEDFYAYDPDLDEWYRISDIPINPYQSRANMTGLELDGFAYIVGGARTTGEADYWRYDPVNDLWTEMGNFPVVIGENVSFILNGKGYIATGGWSGYNYCWEYDVGANQWTRVENVGHWARERAFSFVINNKVYIGGGSGSSYANVEDEMLIWEGN